jgi:hypothetical protein
MESDRNQQAIEDMIKDDEDSESAGYEQHSLRN